MAEQEEERQGRRKRVGGHIKDKEDGRKDRTGK
jgi:hypothetical protein